jgi:cytosine/adenosine deaminase-related metal-dependent hydrolase
VTAVSVLHCAPVVLPITSDPIADGAVAIAGDRIAAVGPREELQARYADARVRQWRGVLTPGLVNAHTHLEFTDFADLAATGMPFHEWIRELIARKQKFTPSMWLESARRGVHQLLRAGTTCVADIVTNGPGLIPPAATGLSGISYVEMTGIDERRYQADLERMLGVLESAPPGRTIGVSPHAPYSMGTEVLRRLGELARERGMRLHPHAAETQQEVEYVGTGGGPFAESNVRFGLELELHGCGCGLSPVGFLDSVGLLGPDVHVAHGVHVDEVDRKLLRDKGTSVALCPRSNAILQAGEAPVAGYLSEGNSFGVGTDSSASTPTLDVLDDVRALRDLAREQGYDGDDLDRRLVTAATVGGATAMGLPDVGRLEAGARADLAVFDIPPEGDAYETLVESGAGRCIATVLAGRIVHRR